MAVRVHAVTVTAPATDLLFGYPIISAGSVDRELVQLAYKAGTNTASSIPSLYLIAPGSGIRLSDGSYPIDTGITFPCMDGASAAVSAQGDIQCWPSHAKQNLAGRFVIPADWTLLAAPLDANMNGTIIFTAIAREMGGPDA